MENKALAKKKKKAGIRVSSKGKVKIPKNFKKGTYKISIQAAGNANYEAKTQYTIIRIV